MKLFIKVLLIPVALFLLIGSVSANNNLIINGSFENGNYTGAGWTRLYAGDTSLPGWSIGGDGVDWHNHAQFGYPPDGDKVIDFNLDGGTIGTISQEFTTTPGVTYTLTFYLAGPGKEFGFPDPRYIKVNVAGVDYIISQSASNFTNTVWGVKQLNFQAVSNITTLTFSSVNSYGFWGPVIDKVDVAVTVMMVMIDIKPGGFPNSINLKSKGNVPVAILSSPIFDATTVDRNSVIFAGAYPLPIGQSPEDVNDDGLLDVVLHFKTQDLNLEFGDTEACLTGNTLNGQELKGCDSVRIVK